MVGENYWYTGVRVHYMDGQWCASVTFYDNGFCDDASSEGTLRGRYFVNRLSDAIDLVLRDTARLGMTCNSGTGCTLYVDGDGEDPGVMLPGDWRECLREECQRRAWECHY